MPALGRLARFDGRIVPTDVIVGVVAVLAKDMELQHALCFFVLSLMGGCFVRIHELEKLAFSPVGILFVCMDAAGAVTAFASYIFQVGGHLFVAVAGEILKAGH